jgi:Ca2+:H+ antiporter
MDSATAALLDSAAAANGNAKEMPARHLAHRTAHNMSSSSLRKKSDLALLRKVPCATLRRLLDNFQEVLLATKLALLFPAVLLALAARIFQFGQATPPPLPPPTVIASFFPLISRSYIRF